MGSIGGRINGSVAAGAEARQDQQRAYELVRNWSSLGRVETPQT